MEGWVSWLRLRWWQVFAVGTYELVSHKLLLIIRATKARKVSLLATPLTVEVAERLGFANHIVEEAQLLKKSREVADAIVKINQDLVLRYKAVFNDGLKLDLGRALSLKNVAIALRKEGLESSNLILGIDFTKSNEWTGKWQYMNTC
ncbi:hypothetical protein JHK82_024439 [Glycine max]|nr:hypothetical protein JHK85_025030 [Glycine max]KAG5012273.1 hypothetical protein JHK86_024534 [Glycine max]KAG5133251.1 hypothetical protein JHK82_024439 [Glycine max]